MANLVSGNSIFGISLGTIVLCILDCTTIIVFCIGCIYYVKILKRVGTRFGVMIARIAVVLAFVGGFPNALDKISRTLFCYDLWFDSTWMFFFIGISYFLLFMSAFSIGKKNKSYDTTLLSIIPITPAFFKLVKYISMMLAAIGMSGFYITMYIKTRKVLGKYAFLYLVTFAISSFVVVYSAKGNFTTVWPNVIAQIANSTGYIIYIIANRKYLQKC